MPDKKDFGKIIVSKSQNENMAVTKLLKERITCRKKFLWYFPKGFYDAKYYAWERGYKWEAHISWEKELNKQEFKRLLSNELYTEAALRAIRIETKTNLLFSFEKMALRDAVKTTAGAKEFSKGLYEYVYGKKNFKERFENFAGVLASLPRKQTRVLTWPLQTVFGFIGDPKNNFFLKPRVTQIAAKKYNFNFEYSSKPNIETYQSLLEFAEQIKKDNADQQPKDMIDLQSFIWVLGSDEYDD